MSWTVFGDFDRYGKWHRCTNVYPQCMGRAALGCCTCPPKPLDRDAWPQGYDANPVGRGKYAGHQYVRKWNIGRGRSRIEVFTTYEGAVIFAEMMAERDAAIAALEAALGE